MKLEVFSVYDEKAKAFISPFILPTTDVAKRTFADCSNDVGHAFFRNPSDYTLYHVGSFDSLSGEIEPCRAVLGTAVEFKKESES